jgi:hypothetical protein
MTITEEAVTVLPFSVQPDNEFGRLMDPEAAAAESWVDDAPVNDEAHLAQGEGGLLTSSERTSA